MTYTFTYHGPFDAVSVRLPSGWREVVRGGSIQVDESDAAALISHPHWAEEAQSEPEENNR